MCLFVSLEVALKMPFIMLGLCRLPENIKVSKHVLKIEAERLMELTAPASLCALSGERVTPHLIILLPPLTVRQCFIC